AGVMAELAVHIGDRVVLTATRADGEVGRALLLVKGVIKTGSKDLDKVIALTNLKGARHAIGLTGDQVHELGLVADPETASEGIQTGALAALKAWDLGQKAPKPPAREVLTWQEAMPEIVGFIEIDDAFNYVYLIVLFVIVAFAIANSFLMVVMERVREFGLLSALGLTGPRIAQLLLLETLVLTLVSLTVGFILGFSGHLAMQHWGINVAEMYGMELGVGDVSLADLILRSELRPHKWLIATAGAGSLVMLSALYPAWRATRMAPAEAMRFYD
ncbi:MAG: ABC transporter permease, partial [Myxococcales bacterium]|nr:ABC transporter permease [Myxococcales bacterium]